MKAVPSLESLLRANAYVRRSHILRRLARCYDMRLFAILGVEGSKYAYDGLSFEILVLPLFLDKLLEVLPQSWFPLKIRREVVQDLG